MQILQKLNNLKRYLGENTDSKFSPEAIADAERFVNTLDVSNIWQPYISFIDDGEVNFWWDYPIRLDLGMYGDGTYSYYASFEDKSELFGDNIPVSESLPTKILENLRV
jgi:hypothetical protein